MSYMIINCGGRGRFYVTGKPTVAEAIEIWKGRPPTSVSTGRIAIHYEAYMAGCDDGEEEEAWVSDLDLPPLAPLPPREQTDD